MKEFEVGMWAYSKTCRDYGIGKIVNITENGQGFKGDLIDIQYKYSKHAIENQDVVASYNIIDLIEERQELIDYLKEKINYLSNIKDGILTLEATGRLNAYRVILSKIEKSDK